MFSPENCADDDEAPGMVVRSNHFVRVPKRDESLQ